MSESGFDTQWRCFVALWQRAAGPARAELVDSLLDRGIRALDLQPPEHAAKPDAEAWLDCEVAVIARSGALDIKAYRRANAVARARRADPVRHFCSEGWRGLHNPSREFDVWWYWAEYLDPTRETANPLLHYLAVGRFEGAAPVPPREPVKPSAPQTGTPRRICLFAGFDPDGEIDETVIRYVTDLARFADVYYLADGYIAPTELTKLEGVTRGAWCLPHGAYDFGSYSTLARDLVGWEVIDQYDELLLANDSGFLVRPLDEVFATMDARPCDWWGLQMTRHDFDRHCNGGQPLPIADVKKQMIGERFMSELDHLHISSYFLAFRKKVVRDEGFRRRLSSVVPQPEKVLVIYKYEIGLSRYLMTRGFDFSTFIDDLYPFHPLYTEDYFRLLARGFPLLKRNFLSENSRGVPDLVHWKTRVREIVPEADLDIVERNLSRVAAADSLHRSFAIVTGADGRVASDKLLVGREVVDEDAVTPTYPHWWAFPVCPDEHVLAGGMRALFESVRDDPSIKKVVLTRSRTVELDGANVSVVPLRSAEGQRLLLRCGLVFVQRDPRSDVQYPLSSERRTFVHIGGRTLTAHSEADHQGGWPSGLVRQDCRAIVSNGGLGLLAARATVDHRTQVWDTGLPAVDLLTCPSRVLPLDIRRQEEELRELVRDRRLIFLDLPFDRSHGYAGVREKTAADLVAFCSRHNAVVGYRDAPQDHGRRLTRLMHDVGEHAIRLSLRRFPLREVHGRVAAGLVSGFSERAITFLGSGKPGVTLRPRDFEDAEFAFDPTKIWPYPVRSDVGAALEVLADHLDGGDSTPSARRSAWARRVLAGDPPANEVARRVTTVARRMLVEEVDWLPFAET